MMDKILRLESKNNNFIEYKIYNNRILLWQLIRSEILQDIISKENSFEVAHGINNNRRLFDLFIYLITSVLYSPYRLKKNDIIVFGLGVSNIKKGKLYYNKVNEYFVDLFRDKTCYIETSKDRKYFLPKIRKNLYFKDLIGLKIFLKSKTVGSLKKEDCKVIDDFIEKLKSVFYEHDLDFKYYEKKLIGILRKIPFYFIEYEKILKRSNPKVIFVEDGNYGGENSVLIAIAKSFGIKVGEFQHGYVGLNHVAYNYQFDNIKNIEEYKRFVPDYYLTYGKFWSENIRIIGKSVEVGNPHFENMIKKYIRKTRVEEEKNILVVSQGTVTKKMVEFTKELVKIIDSKKYKITFRLHPGEVAFKERYEKLYEIDSIQVSNSGDIYELISRSDIIIGSSSTTLFEAKAFDKTVYILRNSDSELFISKEFGIWVNSAEEFYENILQNKQDKKKEEKSFFWADNWEENYKEFLQKEVGIE